MPVPFPAPTFYLNSSRSFYVVHHSGFLDSFLNTPEHSLHDCGFVTFTHRSATMAETTPLLPHANRPPHDHPIFLRVCHSPWRFITQKGLFAVRLTLAVYLTMALALSIYYECKFADRTAKLFPFYASTVSLVIQMYYYWITTVKFIHSQILASLNIDNVHRYGHSSILRAHAVGYHPTNKPREPFLPTSEQPSPFPPQQATHQR